MLSRQLYVLWSCTINGAICRNIVQQRLEHTLNRGILLPSCWHTASLCHSLDEIAGRSADAARSAAYPDLTCEILGMPKTVALPSGEEMAPGSVVALQTRVGERLDHLLCAHVENARWLCHPGSFLEGQLDFDNPFDAADLVEMDILRDAWSEDGKPTHCTSRQTPLLETVLNHAGAWSGVVAIATFKAEELRASTERSLNMALANASFERNPFLWGNSMLTRQLYALWSCTINGAICRNIVQQRLENALNRWILSQSWKFSPSWRTSNRLSPLARPLLPLVRPLQPLARAICNLSRAHYYLPSSAPVQSNLLRD